MAKAPSESRIPTFGSRIPIPGKLRFPSNITVRSYQPETCQPSTNVNPDNKTNIKSDKPPPEIDRTVTISPITTKLEIMVPPSSTQRTCNKTITLSPKTLSENIDSADPNCTVTLDANAAEATFVLSCSSREKSQAHTVALPAVKHEITAQHVGKRVCVGSAQAGVLRYVGEVRFNAGLWCGIELDEPVGKHDGCVKGVRYFSCRAECGILAPACKVSLLLDNKACDTTYVKMISDDNGDDFGPYSLLEVKPSHDDVRVNINNALKCDGVTLNKTVNVKTSARADKDLIKINSESALPVIKNRPSFVISCNCLNKIDVNKTGIYLNSPEINFSPDNKSVSTPCPEKGKGKVKKKCNEDNSSKTDSLNVTICVDLNNTPVLSPVDTPSLTKQNSFEQDESLGILTPDQMIDFSTFGKNTEAASSDDLHSILSSKNHDRLSSSSRTPSSENLGSFSRDGFKLPLSTCLGISSQEQTNSTGIDSSNSPSSEDVKSVASINRVKTISRRSERNISTSRTPSSENLCSELKFATNSITCDSLKVDESLMILSSEQMVDMSVFNQSVASSEDLKSILSSKRSDKTISRSRTPSSENLGSLPHDEVKQSQAQECKDENSLPISRPYSVDLKSTSEPIKSLKLSASNQVELSSPNAVENSMIDFSLGLIEEDMLATGNQFSSLIDTTTNLELPLDSISADKIEPFKSLSRADQTPSPEDLPLDPIDPIKPVELDILEPNLLIPSTDSDTKTDVSKSTTTKTNSFITSVTSITSLDTGYQGDGEMSRPASRGADHSPMAHKPNNPALVNLHWQRAIARRQDPMTDSDFFTESDADVHEENAPRGDRRAQVIDGTLYGVNAQAPAAQDIFIGNQEEMDSSGVFTDLDMNPRTEDYSDGERNRLNVAIEDKSPSEMSTKSITENSQEIKEPEDLQSTLVPENQCDVSIMEVTETISDKPKSPTQSIASNPSSRKTIRTRAPQSKEDNPSKKFKMPKRNVTSKVKTMMEQQKQTDVENKENRKILKKSTNRWDAVMNKISQGKDENKSKIRLKEVKSKISTGIGSSSSTVPKRSETRKAEETIASAKTKIRRVRARGESLAGTKPNSRTTSSVHSSLSDLSISQPSHNKQQPHTPLNRTTKKREAGVGRCATPVTEVLTPGGHKPTPVGRPTITTIQVTRNRDSKKSPLTAVPSGGDNKSSSDRLVPARRPGTVPAIHSSYRTTTVAKDQSRVTGVGPQKGGSPLRNQVLPEKPQGAHLLPNIRHSAKGVEALGVLIQYLVFNLDAFRTPSLKRELDNLRSQWIKDKLELEETRMGYRRLEDIILEQKTRAAQTLEEERVKFRAEITELFEKQRRDISELNEENRQEKLDLERRLQQDNEDLRKQLDAEICNRENEISIRIEAYAVEHKYRLQELEYENEKLRRDNHVAVEILREENDSVREQLDEKTSCIEDLKEVTYINEKLKDEFAMKQKLFEEKLIIAQDEIALLKEENKKILETFKSDTKDNKLQAALGRCTQLQDEVESLRTVLDLKLAELSELRRAHGELIQAAEELPAAVLRAQSLQARVEDLELQIERKSELELQLTKENKKLQESFSQESKQNKRLTLHNEELQWKLKQNSEVVNAILQGQTPNRKSLHGSNQSLCDDMSYKTPSGSYLSRSHHTSSFNEKHHGTSHILERTLSFRERTSHFSKDNPNMNRKSDSQSPSDRFHNKTEYFDMDDSPPSSPKVKGVVEKSDSVSWVLDMDESPEVIASRMVRRAGSFRNVTPPKSTPTKSPASKRPRTKSNNLSLSASAGAIVSPDDKNDNRYRSKSVSLRDSQSPENCHPGEYLSNSWHYSLRTSTPTKSGLEPIRSTVKLENNPDLEHDTDVAISLPALPSEINRKKENCNKPDSLPSLPSGDLLLLQSSFPPKNSAGEAMISESNSEDECSSSTSERSPSVSDTETSEEPTGATGSAEKCVEKSKLQYDLFLLTESTTNSEAMDCSWSEELDV